MILLLKNICNFNFRMANLISFFCGKCRKLLCKGHVTHGILEIKCKCGMTNTFSMNTNIENKEAEGRRVVKK